MRQLKTAFPCSGILYFCFKSLGLDITSMILNPFKMAATYLFFVIYFYQRIIRTVDSRTIHFWLKVFYKFKQIFFLDFKLAWIVSFRLYRRYTYKVFPTSWLALTLDPCPREMNQYFLLELHHVLFTLQPNKKEKRGSSSGAEQTMSSQEHLHSYITI